MPPPRVCTYITLKLIHNRYRKRFVMCANIYKYIFMRRGHIKMTRLHDFACFTHNAYYIQVVYKK